MKLKINFNLGRVLGYIFLQMTQIVSEQYSSILFKIIQEDYWVLQVLFLENLLELLGHKASFFEEYFQEGVVTGNKQCNHRLCLCSLHMCF